MNTRRPRAVKPGKSRWPKNRADGKLACPDEG